MPAIETKELVHSYAEHLWVKPKHALNGLNLTVEEGEIYGYLGANGAGKTTTIKILVGLLRQTAGQAYLFGQNSGNVESRRVIGFQPENPYFYEYLTAAESMDFYAALCDVPKEERAKRSEELLEFVGLKDATKVQVREFSKGMRQRLGIAQALVNEPKLVILDEPMSGLDPVGRRQVRRAILSLKDKGLTVFFSSHILSDMEMICDRIGMLMGGKLVAAGTVDELVQDQDSQIEVAAEGVSDDCRRELAGKAESVVEQGKITYFTFHNPSDAEEAVMKLHEHKAHLTLFRPVRESLEEYFMRTTGQSREEVGAWSGGADK